MPKQFLHWEVEDFLGADMPLTSKIEECYWGTEAVETASVRSGPKPERGNQMLIVRPHDEHSPGFMQTVLSQSGKFPKISVYTKTGRKKEIVMIFYRVTLIDYKIEFAAGGEPQDSVLFLFSACNTG